MSSVRGGFTIIELLLTIVMISVGLVGIMFMFENATKGAMQSDLNYIASNLTREKLERVIVDKVTNGYASIVSGSYPNESFSGDFSPFTRNTTVTEVDLADLSTPQASSGYKRIVVTVSWGAGSGKQVAVPTIIADY